jgi:hypothetical protein
MDVKVQILLQIRPKVRDFAILLHDVVVVESEFKSFYFPQKRSLMFVYFFFIMEREYLSTLLRWIEHGSKIDELR